MSRIDYDETYSYEILDDGYDIYGNGTKSIEQHDPFGKVFLPNGTYEENCLEQLRQMTVPPEPVPYIPTEEEKLRSDVDYIALMEDIELPSYNEGE